MEQKISQVVRELFGVDVEVKLTRPDVDFGDYATNVALQIAKPLGRNPREVADAIVEKLRELGEFSEASVAGPGFINVRVNQEILLGELEKMIAEPDYGRSHLYDNKVVITEYSDPNPFKVLHAGHFYTSVVGAAISELIESAGGTVHRVNFGGDVGMHVAKTMWAIIQNLGGEHPEKLTEIPEDGRSEWMAARYVEGTNAYEDDEVAKAAITELNKKIYQLHTDDEHDSTFAQLYWTCREWSYAYFDALRPYRNDIREVLSRESDGAGRTKNCSRAKRSRGVQRK
jgi:arginyl-tRNA synthetase